MVRIRRALVILQVAAHACIAGQVVVPIDVAIAALQLGVRARDGETHSGVVEVRRLPCGSVVAVLAGLREPQRDVIRVGRFAEIRLVATHTVGWRSLVLAAHVATRAIERGMSPGEGEAGNFQMVEASAEPSRDRMALLASARKSGGDMVGRCCLLIRRRVAGEALERESLKLANGGALVAAVALQRGVSADQRKPVLVIPDSLKRDLPALHGMAPLTICAHLTVVNIGVAIGAPCAGIRENRLGMALCTVEVFVQTQQREICFAVIKFWNRADRLPSEHGVAVLARDVQAAVGTVRRGRTTGLCLCRDCCRDQQEPGENTDTYQLDRPTPMEAHDTTSQRR